MYAGESFARSPYTANCLGSECRRQRARERRILRQLSRRRVEDSCWPISQCSATSSESSKISESGHTFGFTTDNGADPCLEQRPVTDHQDFDLTPNRQLYLRASEENRRTLSDMILRESETDGNENDKGVIILK